MSFRMGTAEILDTRSNFGLTRRYHEFGITLHKNRTKYRCSLSITIASSDASRKHLQRTISLTYQKTPSHETVMLALYKNNGPIQ